MKPIDNPEVQPELFTEFSGEPKKPERLPQINRAQKPIFLSTTAEQIILACIILILAACLVFFLGMLRGRSLGSVKNPVFRNTVPAQTASVRAVEASQKVQERPPAPSAPPPVSSVRVKQLPNTDIAKPYTIQLVTYKKKDLAEKETAALQKSGFYSFIIPSGDYYQVCIGQYENKEDAKKDIKVLATKHKYKDCFLRRR